MNKNSLAKKVLDLYGTKKGRQLFESMLKIAQKDFCVATGWSEDEVSISKGCNYRGTLCCFSSDYQKLTFPSGVEVSMDGITYSEIEKNLQKSVDINDGYRHCDVDRITRKRV